MASSQSSSKAQPDPGAKSAIEFGFPVSSHEPMRHFYRDILGMTFAGNIAPAGFNVEAYTFGNSVVKLVLMPEGMMRPEPRDPDLQNGFISIRVKDAEAVVKDCEGRGVKIFMPLQVADLGEGNVLKAAFVVDPMGNVVELVQLVEGKVRPDRASLVDVTKILEEARQNETDDPIEKLAEICREKIREELRLSHPPNGRHAGN
ncbi:hypothetical protein G7Y89_g3579 [Cudoniella acicularis]|uniref:VOC domain-containing protein n=1 Tax=Cudoniella acicularis TaxID=354080 RepID=A0A8H4RT38_9HELO|nr:hypothetical protein G7Y89_g3579 [Cudoniella acicularis]